MRLITRCASPHLCRTTWHVAFLPAARRCATLTRTAGVDAASSPSRQQAGAVAETIHLAHNSGIGV